MCDVGMTGANNGVIGFEKTSVINKIIYGKNEPFELDEEDISQICAVYLNIDEKTFKCLEITPIRIIEGIK